jgi:hypothetical protein
MIDVNDLKGLLELANDYVDDGLHFLTEPVSYGELKLLAERLISAEKDAARYRWLRESTHFDSMQHKLYCLHYGERLDIAIDEAMQCNK